MSNKFIPVSALVISIFVTIVLWNTIINLEIENNQLEFDIATEKIQSSIDDKLNQYRALISGAKGFFSASQLVEPTEWTEFVNAQDIKERFPGIQGLGYARHLENEEEITSFIQFMNIYGIDFQINPEGKRDEYYPIVYLEPQDSSNIRAIGYDIYSEPTRRQAVEIAKDTGKNTITGKITLVQETKEDTQFGFLMIQPVYENGKSSQTEMDIKDNIVGFVYAPFRINDLMKAALDPLLLKYIDLKIYDGNEEPQNLFFTNEDTHNQVITGTKTTTLTFGQKTWTLVFQNLKPYDPLYSLFPNLILVTGISMSVLLFFVFYFINKSNVLMQERIKNEKFLIIGELSARLSHNLRNPLSIIKMGVEFVDSKYNEKFSEEDKINIKRIKKAIDRIAYQVENILSFVKTISLSLESVSLKTILVSSLESLKIPNRIKITIPESDVEVFVDSIQMEIVFSNILMNSIQSLGESGEIEIKFTENSDSVEIQFIDSGPGIPEDKLSKIFEPLFTTKQTGTGLGLASCMTIIKNHGGTISAKNNPTTFSISLPKRNRSES